MTGLLIMQSPIIMDDLGVPLFLETPKSGKSWDSQELQQIFFHDFFGTRGCNGSEGTVSCKLQTEGLSAVPGGKFFWVQLGWGKIWMFPKRVVPPNHPF